jgi:hypothetical protein
VAIVNTDFPEGVGSDMYDAVTAEMGIQDDPPPGLIFHWAGEVYGRWAITDVWESREAYDRFSEERLQPAVQKVVAAAGGEMTGQPTTHEYPVHNFIKP